MTSRDFVYWLQGYFEIETSQPRPAEWTPFLNSDQVKIIRNHLNMVFKHEIDPSHGDKEHQKKLSDSHKGQEDSLAGALKKCIDRGKSDPGSMFNC